MPFYRNRETHISQFHPVSGIGDDLNSDEVGEDGKPVKPLLDKAPTPKQRASRTRLLRDQSKTPGGTASGDSNKQEGTK